MQSTSSPLIYPFFPNGLDTLTIENLFCSAMEGGSNYWYYLPDLSMIDPEFEKLPYSESIPRTCLKNPEVKIPVSDIEDISEHLGYISAENMKRGEELMRNKYPSHYADAIDENDDATTGDVYFQLVILGEVIYG